MLHLCCNPSVHAPLLHLHTSHWDVESEEKCLFTKIHPNCVADKDESLCRLAGNNNPNHRRGSSSPKNTDKLPWSPGEVQEALAITRLISPILTVNRNQQYPNHKHHEVSRSWAPIGSSLFPCSHQYKPSLHQTSPRWGFHMLISFKNIHRICQ